jgi:hypothetical protein
MTDVHQNRDAESQSGGSSLVVFWLLLLAPALYVLSFGPAVWLHERDYVSTEFVLTWYAPVKWLHVHTFLAKPLEWYANLWV